MIIWLASYPRSGNTFFRRALYSRYGVRSGTLYHHAKPPQSGSTGYHDATKLEGFASDTDAHWVKTHGLPLQDEFPAVYLLRDGRDSLVSYAHFVLGHEEKDGANDPDLFHSTLSDLIVAPSEFGTWSENVRSWVGRPNVQVVRFEDLIADPAGELARVRRQLGMTGDGQTLGEIPTFRELHKAEPSMFRSGLVGGWRTAMPTDLEELFWQHHGEVMESVGYRRDLESARSGPSKFVSAVNASPSVASTTPSDPTVSIIVSCDGDVVRSASIDSWVAQTYGTADFEIVAVAHASQSSASLDALRARLRPHDQVILASGTEAASKFDLGAKAATGNLLLLTNDRVVADPTCIEIALPALVERSLKAASLRWGYQHQTKASSVGQLLGNQQVASWNDTLPTSRVRTDGFLIDRSVFESVGGFDRRYGELGEDLLGARLDEAGIEIGVVGQVPLVRSVENFTLRAVRAKARRRMRDEYAFVSNGSNPNIAARYFSAGSEKEQFAMPKWMQTFEDQQLYAHKNSPEKASLFSTFMNDRLDRLDRFWSAARFRFSVSESARFHALVTHEQLTQHFMVDARQRRNRKDLLPGIRIATGKASNLEACDIRYLGPLEYDNGVEFRWSNPVASHRLVARPGKYAIHFDTGAIRGSAESLDVDVFCNAKRISPEMMTRNEGWISVAVTVNPGDDDCWITTAIAPLHIDLSATSATSTTDNRSLGLPICRVRVESLDAIATGPSCPPFAGRPAVLVSARSESLCSVPPSLPPKRKVLVVNTSDLGGGAEVVALACHQGYQRQTLDSWLVVGDKKTSGDASIVSMFASPLVDYGPVQTIRSQTNARVRRAIGRPLGHDDFEWPQTSLLSNITGSQPDLIHLHNLHGGYFDLRQLPQLSQAFPTFLTLHDEWAYTGHCAYSVDCDRWEQHCGSCPSLAAPPAIVRDGSRFNHRRKAGIYEHCRLFLATPTQWLMDRAMRSVLQPAIVSARVISNGIDLNVFCLGSKSEARARLGLPQNEFIAAFAASAGSATSYKGFETLLESFKMLSARSGAPINLVAAGKAAEVEHHGNLTVHHLRRLGPEEMALLYRSADIYVHAAEVEVQGLVLLESMACGTPVVATEVGGIPEVIQHREQGLLVPSRRTYDFAQAVEEMLVNTEFRDRLGKAGVAHATRNFDQKHMVQKYLDWFNEVLEDSQAQGASPQIVKAS